MKQSSEMKKICFTRASANTELIEYSFMTFYSHTWRIFFNRKCQFILVFLYNIYFNCLVNFLNIFNYLTVIKNPYLPSDPEKVVKLGCQFQIFLKQ